MTSAAARLNKSYRENTTTKPRGILTNYGNPKCYANILNDCCTKLSLEHIIAKCGLKKLFAKNLVEVQGLSNETITVPPPCVASKILCERHNNILGSVDSHLEKFIETIQIMHGDITPILFQTNLNEQFLCKILLQMGCGILALNNVNVPNRWVEILFSDEKLTLYTRNALGSSLSSIDRITATLLNDGNKNPVGIECTCKGFNMCTFIDQVPTGPIKLRKIKMKLIDNYKSKNFTLKILEK